MARSDGYKRGLVGRSAPSPDDHPCDGLDGLIVDGVDPHADRRRKRLVALTRDERKRQRHDESLWRRCLCQ